MKEGLQEPHSYSMETDSTAADEFIFMKSLSPGGVPHGQMHRLFLRL